jgi:hypothetical protein
MGAAVTPRCEQQHISGNATITSRRTLWFMLAPLRKIRAPSSALAASTRLGA